MEVATRRVVSGDCCKPSYEELEDELRTARAGREAWKEFALKHREAISQIVAGPLRGESHKTFNRRCRRIALDMISLVPRVAR